MSKTQRLCALYAVPTSKQSSECLYNEQTPSISQQLVFAAWSRLAHVSAIQQPSLGTAGLGMWPQSIKRLVHKKEGSMKQTLKGTLRVAKKWLQPDVRTLPTQLLQQYHQNFFSKTSIIVV